MVPEPQRSTLTPIHSNIIPDSIETSDDSYNDEIDFGTAFSEDTSDGQGKIDESLHIPIIDTIIPGIAESEDTTLSSPTLPSPKQQQKQENMVRVAIQKNLNSFTLYSVGMVKFHSSGMISNLFRGRVTIKKTGKNSVLANTSEETLEIDMPCTLLSDNKYNYIESNSKSYRGAMIIADDNAGRLILVNYLPVEDYLRGVVPLEIGHRAEVEIEAIKAQAIAARTYSYRRIKERQSHVFDLNSSVADQVYGGADAEYRESDIAIKLTQDLVLIHNDSLIYAYYHSTCGGQTASINAVWNKMYVPYLVSIKDVNSSGKPFCSISPAYKWKEQWTRNAFTLITLKNLPLNSNKISGTIKSGNIYINIDQINSCGRVRRLFVQGSGWKREIFGDKTRYVFRRNTAGLPILRSARFKIKSFTNKNVVLEGYGYGHGVGMCQMGAIGRARAGQKYDTILKAYYSGTEISMISQHQ